MKKYTVSICNRKNEKKKISGRNTPRIDFGAKYHNIKITCIIAPKRNETKKGYNPDLLRVTGRPE